MGSGCTPGEPGLDAAVHLLAGAPGSFCIWEQEIPTGGKRVHLDGALERKDTDVGWQPAFVQNKNKISPAWPWVWSPASLILRGAPGSYSEI